MDTPMKATNPLIKKIPLEMVGSTAFGRYPKISLEQTVNMIISDDFLVPSAGHQLAAKIVPEGEGRGGYNSNKLGQMIVVIDNGVYLINSGQAYQRVGTVDTLSGDVSIAENNASQIAICDQLSLYIYDYSGNVSPRFQKANLFFRPAYVASQAGYFIAAAPDLGQWIVSDPNDGLSWPANPQNIGEFQTKADKPIAILPIPGSSNSVMVIGSIVTEIWTLDPGAVLFPYTRNSYHNIDFGCPNTATLDQNQTLAAGLFSNEKSGPVIMVIEGGSQPTQLSNDGINFKLASLKNPQDSCAFFFKQDGHLIYQLTFMTDNFTVAYDFTTQKFFTLTDEDMNYHVAKRMMYFNDRYYFISINDGNLYQSNSAFTTYNGAEIPRIRVGKSIRAANGDDFIIQNLSFPLEQGEDSDKARVDFSSSIDGGASFGTIEGHDLQALGKRRNRFDIWNLGMANEFIPQFRFWGMGRFVIGNGEVSLYQ
jgi:hypothetical protein